MMVLRVQQGLLWSADMHIELLIAIYLDRVNVCLPVSYLMTAMLYCVPMKWVIGPPQLGIGVAAVWQVT